MKKFFLLSVIFLLNTNIFAQELEYSIIIKDIETLMPIENVTVFIMKTKQSLISNAHGKVTFLLNGASNVQISETNYEKLTLRWTTLKENHFVVYLKHNHNRLDEIVVSKESPYKTLQKIINNSKEKLAIPHRLKVYVREFFIMDNKYSYYNDGLVNFQFTVNQRKINTTLLVEQNRSYGLVETDVSADLKGYNLNNIMENYSNLEYFNPILSSETRREYSFTTKIHPSNINYYILSVMPVNKSKKILDTFEIIYDPEKKLVVEYSIIVEPSHLSEIEENKKLGSKNMTRSIVKVTYRVDGPDYYVLNTNEEIGYDLVLKDQIKNIQVRNSFITTNFNRQNFTYNETDVFKEKTLFNKKNKILTNYWDISGFIATDEEKAIISSLEFKL